MNGALGLGLMVVGSGRAVGWVLGGRLEDEVDMDVNCGWIENVG